LRKLRTAFQSFVTDGDRSGANSCIRHGGELGSFGSYSATIRR
jgi:hypothetical protein